MQSWRDYFEADGDYLPQHQGYFTTDRTQAEVSFVLDQVIRTSSDTILDLACGQGRHTLALRQRGYDVIGVDMSNQLLAMAEAEASKQGIKASFIHQDMRQLRLDRTFDVILILFCPFGIYSDAVNHDILKGVAHHLKPGGRFFMEIHNLFRFVRRMLQTQTSNAVLDLQTLTLWDRTEGENELPLRLYTVPELKERFIAAGLEIKQIWGGYDQSAYDFDSDRLLILAELQR